MHQLVPGEGTERFDLTRVVGEVAVPLLSIHTFPAACVVYGVNAPVTSKSHFPVAIFIYKNMF